MLYKIEKYDGDKIVEINEVKEGSIIRFTDKSSLILLGVDRNVALILANRGFLFNDNVAYNLKESHGRSYGIIEGISVTPSMVSMVASITLR